MNSNNFFQLIADFQKNIDWLNQVLLGGDNDTILIDGVAKPSISKEFADRFTALQAMIEGRAAYETKADLPATPPAGVVLAEVWNDPVVDNNVMYGWTGSEWKEANTDLPGRMKIVEVASESNTQKTSQISERGNKTYAYSICDKNGNIAFGVTDKGEIEVHTLTAPYMKDGFHIIDVAQFKSIDPRFAFAIADKAGKIAAAVRNDGSFSVVSIETKLGVSIADTALITRQTKAGYSQIICDSVGNIAGGVKNDGTLHWHSIQVSKINGMNANDVFLDKRQQPASFSHEINFFPCYGQSLSVGQALPVQTNNQRFDNLMFTRGMRPQYDYENETEDQWYQNLVPLKEEIAPEGSNWAGRLGETPVAGQTDIIKELIENENGVTYQEQTYQLLGSAPGWGATTIAGLSKGTGHYSRMMEQVDRAMTLAASEDKTFTMQAMSWVQGESDYLSSTTYENYLSRYKTLFTDVNTDVKAKTNQSHPVRFISYQLASHVYAQKTTPNIALALLDAANSTDGMYLACPTYHLPHSDGFHLTGSSSKILGGYLGLAYKRVVVDERDFKPLQPVSHNIQGRIIQLKFNVPYPPLKLDTDLVALASDYGFSVVDDNGDPVSIKSINVSQPDTLKIVLESDLPANSKVRYAWSGTETTGPLYGPRGNLRDSQGDVINFHNYPMHNWCVIFEYSL